jgi:hypothetical protein
MKKACLVVNGYLKDNLIFMPDQHRDNWADRFFRLKKAFADRGYDLSTDDINPVAQSEVVIYAANMPKQLPKPEDKEKSYLILSESPFIRPENYDIEKHDCFNKVFTWHDEYVNGQKYIKLNYAHAFPEMISKNLGRKERRCVLIAGNKKPKKSLEDALFKLDLYQERENAIRWFEKNHPEDFDLYGVGWDRYVFSGPRIVQALNRVSYLPEIVMKLTGKTYSSYRGTVAQKKDVMERYRFSICYENAKDIPGYITEKIFDSFFAGCVPVYLGANNVKDFIPEKCFIDKRQFPTYEELYEYLTAMSDDEYLSYLHNIEHYLNSDLAFPFRSEGFVQAVVENIFDDQSKA